MTGPAQPRRRVLVVDDSPTTRRLLKRELEKDPLIEVIGLAGDPYEARDLIVKLQPDVLTMDLEMPRMDGIQFLRRLMHYYPLPVLIFSNHTAEGSEIALETLRLGAVDVFAKPDGFNLDGYAATIQRMRSTIKEACSHRPGKPPPSGVAASAGPGPNFRRSPTDPNRVVLMGASTGGPQAIETILRVLPEHAPAIVVVVHMPAGFTHRFAQRLDKVCAPRVSEATRDVVLEQGQVLIAPGDQHVALDRKGSSFMVRMPDGPPVMGHRPSVEVLFQSGARVGTDRCMGVLLTGMGRDGSTGLKALRDSKAMTLTQDAETSIVHGMPGEAERIGASCLSCPLDDIAHRIAIWWNEEDH